MSNIIHLRSMLTKAGVSEDEIANGFHLSEKGARKVADRLGIPLEDVELLTASLTTEVRNERSRRNTIVTEYQNAVGGRFSYEPDYLNNITIHDTKTGKSVFLRGSDAVSFLTKLKGGEDEQKIMASYVSLNEAGLTHAEQEEEHGRALDRTGFWGSQGAGCIVMAQTTGRILLAHRSLGVEQPGTWGNWGGAIDQGEDPAESVVRELSEEAGYHGAILANIPLYVFKKGTFTYSNFLVIVEDEFRPRLNWESQGADWFELGQWPSPLHFGLQALFGDATSAKIIKQMAERTVSEGEVLDEDYASEVAGGSGGSYNFPWSLNGEQGYGTARFSGQGEDMNFTIISVRDKEGEELEMSPADKQQLHKQAVAFIGNE